jgi:hypothetical protein
MLDRLAELAGLMRDEAEHVRRLRVIRLGTDGAPPEFIGVAEKTVEAPWRGESLQGKHIYVQAEQRFGDTLHFVRYLPLLAARAGKVTVRVHQQLVTLLRESLSPLHWRSRRCDAAWCRGGNVVGGVADYLRSIRTDTALCQYRNSQRKSALR